MPTATAPSHPSHLSHLSHLSVLARRRDPELERIYARLGAAHEVVSRNELADLLGHLLRLPAAHREHAQVTLDLIGHSMPGTNLLRLGDWVIDAAQSSVTAFFRELTEHAVLPRLGITAVRLLGCATASTPESRYTVCALADLLGVEVYGTTDMVAAAHYDPEGFAARYAHLLAPSAALRGAAPRYEPRAAGGSGARTLDLDALPRSPLGSMPPTAWPRYLLDRATAADVLRMVRRTEGAEMPGLLATPACELALPLSDTECVRIEILLGGEFVRVYPRDGGGLLYPVADVGGLRRLVADLGAADR